MVGQMSKPNVESCGFQSPFFLIKQENKYAWDIVKVLFVFC